MTSKWGMSRDFNIVCIAEGGIPMLGFPLFTSIELDSKVLCIESIYKSFHLCIIQYTKKNYNLKSCLIIHNTNNNKITDAGDFL